MTLRIFESTYRDYPCWKCVVRMSYKKDDKTLKIQKTWRAVGEFFSPSQAQVEPAFRAAAKRWHQETLSRLIMGKQPELRQEEIEINEKGE